MKKLKLNLDEIKVESYEINQTTTDKGTLYGQWGEVEPNMLPGTGLSACDKNSGCQGSCIDSCAITCFDSCNSCTTPLC